MMLLAALLLPLCAGAQQNNAQAFQPYSKDYAITVGTTCTPAQIPTTGANSSYPLVSVMLTNTGASPAYVALDVTQAGVTSPTIAAGGSGTLGSAANTTPVLTNGVIFTVPDGSWICAITSSGSTTLHVQIGRGQ